jgi:hypothetical protein
MALSTTDQLLTSHHRSFLLRCVGLVAVDGEKGGETAVWRFTLRDVAAEPQEHLFSTINELADFLTAELNQNNAA